MVMLPVWNAVNGYCVNIYIEYCAAYCVCAYYKWIMYATRYLVNITAHYQSTDGWITARAVVWSVRAVWPYSTTLGPLDVTQPPLAAASMDRRHLSLSVLGSEVGCEHYSLAYVGFLQEQTLMLEHPKKSLETTLYVICRTWVFLCRIIRYKKCLVSSGYQDTN